MRKRLGNGDLFFMYEIPDEVEGYTKNPENENHFIQIMPECSLRERVKCGNCSTPVYKKVCTIGRPLDCVECEERIP